LRKIGITTTVPVEILIAAGVTPVDLNNLFVTSGKFKKYIEIAEQDGFPGSICSWIKGIYGVCIEENISEIIGVVGGDCSNTKSLCELLAQKGIKVHPFAFPHSRSAEELKSEMSKIASMLGTTLEKAELVRKKLLPLREKGAVIDNLNSEGKCSGLDSHLWQVSFSDFNGDFVKFESELDSKISEISNSNPILHSVRVGYLGVPPIIKDLYSFIEEKNGLVVYNEVQREFAFPRALSCSSLEEQYTNYTYPYDNSFRIEEIKKEIESRNIDCIIHYVQSFCHRAIDDMILKSAINIPILTIEGDKEEYLDGRTKLRLETFIDMVQDLKEEKSCV
jgi:benzoyl-CoA reductase/2-hydroxyglutaryl-CoA dehydratase subunit BcrC/BadD/HgdB